MKPPRFDYHAPRTIDEAVALLARYGGDAKPLAGGQSLVPLLNFRLARPAALIDLNRIPALAGIREVDGHVAFGAMTRQRAVEFSPVVARALPLLTEATRWVGHLPIRSRGTIGGSIAHADPSAEYPAVGSVSGPYYFLEQLGFRKVIDTTFMMATMITGSPDPADLKKYFAALRLAQRDIDLRPELYTKHYRNEFPKRFLPQLDTRRWGPGERIVFEPYTREVFEDSFKWIREREIFEPGKMPEANYEQACMTLTA